jgi:hypothetical protein
VQIKKAVLFGLFKEEWQFSRVLFPVFLQSVPFFSQKALPFMALQAAKGLKVFNRPLS